MENSLLIRVPNVEVLEKLPLRSYEIKNKQGVVVRSGNVYELKVSAPQFVGYLKTTQDIYDSVDIKSVYNFGGRLYENSKLNNIKVTEIIK